MSKNYILKKTSPEDIIFIVHPISNPSLSKMVYLNKNLNQVALPEDWALGIFFDDGLYAMYKQGLFTFDDNDGLAKAAYENGVYFDDKLDFSPATAEDSKNILTILSSGNRANILQAVEEYGDERVRAVAIANADEFKTPVVRMLESIFNIQLILNVE